MVVHVGLTDTVKQLLQVLEEKMRELVTINDQVVCLLPTFPSFINVMSCLHKFLFHIR